MSRRGENIWHRKDGRWEARYVKEYNGKRAVYGYLYGRTYSEVKQKQQEALLGVRQQCTGKQISFSELTDAFLCQKKYAVKKSSFACYQNKISAYLMPYWEKVPIQQITGITVDRYSEYLFSVRELSGKTVKDILILLNSILDFGYENQILHHKIKVRMPQVSRKETVILEKAEQERLLTYLLKEWDYPKAGVLLALMTGMRIGEICALQKKCINFEDSYVMVQKTMQRIRKEDGYGTTLFSSSPKSVASLRKIPLPYMLSSKIQILCETLHEEDYLITGEQCCMEPRTYYRKYQHYLKECGLHQKGYTFHTLRHTFATEAIRSGFDAKSLSEILGHAGVKITLERYVHPSEEQKKQEMERFVSCHSLQSCLQSADNNE